MTASLLFVDDDQNVISGARRALRECSYCIHSALSGEEALELLENVAIDVIVADQGMAGMSGTELLSLVRAKYPRTIRFMLTGQSSLEVAIDAVNRGGIAQFFTKPCDAREIVTSIESALVYRDLLCESKQLLALSARQSKIIEQLERRHPGISHVTRDSSQNIIVDDEIPCARSLTQEICDFLCASTARNQQA